MIVWNIDIKAAFAGMNQTSQPVGFPLTLLFIKPAEQCFSLTTKQPEQCFSAKFQTSERAQRLDSGWILQWSTYQILPLFTSMSKFTLRGLNSPLNVRFWMMSCSSCGHLVLLTLYSFYFQPKRFSDRNNWRIQVLQDAFVLILQSYFCWVRTKERLSMFSFWKARQEATSLTQDRI